MDKSKPRSVGGPQATYWRSFPYMEAALRSERAPVIDKMAETCRKLDAIIKSGSVQEKQRAQAAMTAYARTLELYRGMEEALTRAGN